MKFVCFGSHFLSSCAQKDIQPTGCAHESETTCYNVIRKRRWVSESAWTGLSVVAKKLLKRNIFHGDISRQKLSHFLARTLQAVFEGLDYRFDKRPSKSHNERSRDIDIMKIET